MLNGLVSRLNSQKHLLFILSLLLTQWLFFAHVHDHVSNIPDTQCSVCLLGEHLGHAVITAATSEVFPLLLSLLILLAQTHAVTPPPFQAFRSRAPPALL